MDGSEEIPHPLPAPRPSHGSPTHQQLYQTNSPGAHPPTYQDMSLVNFGMENSLVAFIRYGTVPANFADRHLPESVTQVTDPGLLCIFSYKTIFDLRMKLTGEEKR